MKVLLVVGARPQFIKMAPLGRRLEGRHEAVLVHTGQHYDHGMSDVFFEELKIMPPHHHLGVGSGRHGAQTGRMLAALEEVILDESPDCVVVYGDTNSTLAGALAAAKLEVPVGHVEAGLRSFDRTMPEELNRVVTDHLSTGLFCPSDTAVQNLRKEGVVDGVHMVGDVMVDAFQEHLPVARKVSDVLARNDLEPGGYWLATVHRAGNTDDPVRLRAILEAFAGSGETVLLPLHPRTVARVDQHGLRPLLDSGDVRVVPPLPYLDMLAALSGCKGVLTDSGGLQKEAYLAGKPGVTLRDNTEWVETVEAGWNLLVGADEERILEAMRSFRPSGDRATLYGDGKASERIVALLPELSQTHQVA
ncbi:MAG: UDP-N-acetylglucosamine 2-epimerase (non-hydrolyzing) [Euryarchaeota archaeon]|nr:UDP-N-acetylglucosamine 2-epimerase (non-hydrolyzing) [Euryarchaeota archaeon]